MSLTEIKSLKWADFFLYALIDPRHLSRIIKSREPGSFLLSFAVPAFVTLADVLVLSLMGIETSYFYYKVTYGWITLYLIIISLIILSACIMDMSSQFMGHQGRVRDMISIINYSVFPKAFLLPVVYIFHVLNFASVFFYVFITFLLFIWSAFVAIEAISEMHSAGFGSSLVIYLTPVLFLGIINFFVFILMIMNLAGLVFA